MDLVASALLSLADLNLEESIVCAKEGRTQWPRALFLVKQQGVAEYTVALLACLKIGLEVVLINSSQTQESDYVGEFHSMDSVLNFGSILILMPVILSKPKSWV